MKTKTPWILLILLFLLVACAQGTTELKPPEIRYGEDVCADCNMIISDPRFATAYAYEVSPGRYQSALFDDLGDMLIYADKNPTHRVVAWYVHDYETKEWTDATMASYLISDQVETPMASGIVSFARSDRAEAMAYSLGTEVMDWNTLQEKYKTGEIGVGMAGAAMTMGHGSPGNVNPTPQGNGHYLGTVNFTMSGPWTVTVVAKRDQTMLGEVVFEFAVR